MPQKTIKTKVTLGIADPRQDSPLVRDPTGAVLHPGSKGLGHAAPGTPVTLDADEADWIIARFGGEVLEEIPDEPADAEADTGSAKGAGK